jgi:hypothetical protein
VEEDGEWGVKQQGRNLQVGPVFLVRRFPEKPVLCSVIRLLNGRCWPKLNAMTVLPHHKNW